MVVLALPSAHLALGDFVFDGFVPYELKSDKANSNGTTSGGACGADSSTQSRDLSYQIYISACSMAESEDVQSAIQFELNKAPHVILERQATPDAHFYRNWVKTGSLSFNDSELRARLTGNNTLSLILALTILPDTGDATYPFNEMKVAAAGGDFNWVGDTVTALLFDENSTAPHELWATSLTDFTSLSELTTFGYVRQAVSGRSISAGAPMQLLMDNPSLAVGDAVGCIIFQDNGSDGASIPLFMNIFSEPGESASFNLAGLF